MGPGLTTPTAAGVGRVLRAVPDLVLPADPPTYRWGWAPGGLATRRQLAALGLRPGRTRPAAYLEWRRGDRWAALYPIHLAVPKRPATPAQLAALDKAMTARRTCPVCGTDVGYVLPTRYRACIDCHPTNWSTAA
jgi:hypothetical protein